jgi:hypothetical protein
MHAYVLYDWWLLANNVLYSKLIKPSERNGVYMYYIAQYFGRRHVHDIGLASYSIIHLRFTIYSK